MSKLALYALSPCSYRAPGQTLSQMMLSQPAEAAQALSDAQTIPGFIYLCYSERAGAGAP